MEHALDAAEATSEEYANQVSVGSPWIAPVRSVTRSHGEPDQRRGDEDPDSMPSLVEIQEPNVTGDPPGPINNPEEREILNQEHYNHWLEDMVKKHGGEFDERFYRQTISPNVHHFLCVKEEITTAFDLKRRKQEGGSTAFTIIRRVLRPLESCQWILRTIVLYTEPVGPRMKGPEDQRFRKTGGPGNGPEWYKEGSQHHRGSRVFWKSEYRR
ncbi:hypothetical protein DFH07DRAFT_779689 [Mycena maculata]|uniref:DUF6589 domain-containing protein n=1 Tax=Mycena maculata TaxID=230809 RepID=A0AAD7MXB8_9AGAR|nr:hypothetical protein DFH07DRAFT_779689 [Mycena maculata]